MENGEVTKSLLCTHELLDLKGKRRMFERKLMKENTQENKENYRNIKNSYNRKLKSAQKLLLQMSK
jgi:hypothetical protein